MTLSPRARRVVFYVATHNAATLREIADAVGLKSAGTMAVIVRQLKRQGILKSDLAITWDTPFRTRRLQSRSRSIRLADGVVVGTRGNIYKIVSVLDNYDKMPQTATERGRDESQVAVSV